MFPVRRAEPQYLLINAAAENALHVRARAETCRGIEAVTDKAEREPQQHGSERNKNAIGAERSVSSFRDEPRDVPNNHNLYQERQPLPEYLVNNVLTGSL